MRKEFDPWRFVGIRPVGQSDIESVIAMNEHFTYVADHMPLPKLGDPRAVIEIKDGTIYLMSPDQVSKCLHNADSPDKSHTKAAMIEAARALGMTQPSPQYA